jgi:uncharacterized protein YegJ (DUF2314 family)
MRILLRCALLALCMAGLPACKNKEKEQRKADLRALMNGTIEDPEMKAAMQKAQESVPEFLDALRKANPEDKDFILRKKFPAGGEAQQTLMVTELTFDGTNVHGTIRDNLAKPWEGAPKDGKVTVAPGEIVDWMFFRKGTVVGGFMLRALKKKMTEEEWKGYERQFSERGYTFPE